MPDSISPLRVAVAACGRLAVRFKRNLLLFLLLVGFAYLDQMTPPDPFTWMLQGLPLMILVTPVEVLAFHSLLSGAAGETRLVPEGMLWKCALFFLWSCLALVLSDSTVWGFILLIPASLAGALLGLVVESTLAIQIANVVALGLVAVGVYFLISRALVFPGIVAGAAKPFRNAGIMIKGTFWRFCLSFVLLVLPLMAAMILLDRFGQGGERLSDAGLLAQGCMAVLDAAADMLCFSGLCVWYEKLRQRAAGPETGSGVDSGFAPESAPVGPADPRTGSGVGPYAE